MVKKLFTGYVELCSNKKREFCNPINWVSFVCVKALASISQKVCCQNTKSQTLNSTYRTFNCAATVKLTASINLYAAHLVALKNDFVVAIYMNNSWRHEKATLQSGRSTRSSESMKTQMWAWRPKNFWKAWYFLRIFSLLKHKVWNALNAHDYRTGSILKGQNPVSKMFLSSVSSIPGW